MLSTDAILETAAREGSIDISEWPRVLESVLQRLHDIVYNDFPLPSLPLPPPLPPPIDPEVVASTPPPHQPNDLPPADHDEDLPDADAENEEPPPNSQNSSKENDAPTDIAARRPQVPGFHVNHTSQFPVQPPDTIPIQEGTLPPDLLSMYQSTTRLLEKDFAASPPYTVQRLAEMVLYPKKYYRFLPAYLRALDRIVSVSSPVSDFPLPTFTASVNGGGFLTNGDASQVNGISERETLGSDESLGGALLTPIPWLRNTTQALTGQANAGGSQDGELHSESTETIEGPNGAGSIETVSVTVNGIPSVSTGSTGVSGGPGSTPASPTLSEQSDASTSSSTGSASEAPSASSTDAQLRQQGGVTQGELLRQEQEAGVVPVSQANPRRSLISGGAAAVGRAPAPSGVMAGADAEGAPRDTATEIMMEERQPEETPHARGPEEIGMEDMGPQHQPLGEKKLDMEAAVGRAKSPPTATSSEATGLIGSPPLSATKKELGADDEMEERPEKRIKVSPAPEAKIKAEEAKADDSGAPGKDPEDVEKAVAKLKEEMEEDVKVEVKEEQKDGDGDVIIADADGRPMGEGEGIKREVSGDLAAPDSSDTTAL